MTQWKFQETGIPGLWDITPFRADDVRGSFIKDYSEEVFLAHGIQHALREVFYTVSRRGVIRALHFQRVRQQPKLVRCIWGHVWDAAVDLRRDSPTFRQWRAFELTGENNREILVPAGCAHGYLVLADSVVSYKCAEKFYPEYDDGIRWNDPDIGVEWPLARIGGAEQLILAEKDKNLQSFAELMAQYDAF